MIGLEVAPPSPIPERPAFSKASSHVRLVLCAHRYRGKSLRTTEAVASRQPLGFLAHDGSGDLLAL